MLDLVNGFIVELRAVGIPASLTETIDAVQAVENLGIDDRESLRTALAATLVKNQAHRRAFDTIFEVYFSLRGPQYAIEGTDEQIPPSGAADAPREGDSLNDLSEALFAALRSGEGMRSLAGAAVSRFAGMEAGRAVGGTYYLYRTLRNLDLDGALENLLNQAQMTDGDPLDDLDLRLLRDTYENRIAELKSQIEAEIRRRLVADRGVEAMAKTLRKPLPADIEFMHATREEMASLRKALHPLTRKLAARLARRRRHGRRGPLDFRSTVRHSLSYGGVLAEPKFKHPRPHKPEIMVVADVSGSVAAFARFTLHLVYAISNQFTKVRSFAFIDGLDEVTHVLEGADDVSETLHRVHTEANVVWLDGHSDYGHAFGIFWDNFNPDIGPRTTVLILGDARNNYHASGSHILKDVKRKARKVYWLNPEPHSYWNTGDSSMSDYSPHCDGVFEVRNLRQLEAFIDHLV